MLLQKTEVPNRTLFALALADLSALSLSPVGTHAPPSGLRSMSVAYFAVSRYLTDGLWSSLDWRINVNSNGVTFMPTFQDHQTP
ncbi:hypothetical protein EV421DRAFT_967871 [Armillaria borealis]|uniref:Uncharacterized protein n=1 Tax=Armillaria borealis TaxID=47425 RepID=A0AA39J993_9AGAR|nr:hypothetical protein EV421DRAFT_967871 [Armillaria borealis]